GGAVDFDAIYEQAILPAAAELGLDVRRADTLETRGVIIKAIYEAVLGADFMIADLSLNSPNVVYELGIRHATRPSGTVAITCSDRLPYDLQSLPVVTYSLADGYVDDVSAQRLAKSLAQALRS